MTAFPLTHRNAMRQPAILAAALLLAAATATAPAAHAQDAPEPGQRVRVLAPQHGVTSPIVATLREVAGDTLVLDLSRETGDGLPGIEMRLPASSVLSLEVSRGARNRAVTGATGLVGGLATGYAASRLHRRFSIGCGTSCGLTGKKALPYDDSLTPKIIGAGGLIGLVVGVVLPGESWERAGRVRLSVDEAPRGGALGLSLRF